jgi:hypothetical protein
MANGMANNAAIVDEEALDVSTVGIICTTAVYGVPCTRGLLSDGVKLERRSRGNSRSWRGLPRTR